MRILISFKSCLKNEAHAFGVESLVHVFFLYYINKGLKKLGLEVA